MEHQKILNLFNDANNSKFVIRKWNITNYAAAIEITYNTEILKYNHCDYDNAYILLAGHITVVAAPSTQVSLTNCAPSTKTITKVY